MRRIVTPSVVFALLALAGLAWANTRYEITEDFGPPTWHDNQNLSLIDGELFALHDDEWAAIAFWRPPEDIPSGFDLLNDFDASVFGSDLYVGGSVQFDADGNLLMAQVHGVAPMPVWFVDWGELQAACADGVLTIEELASLDSLVVGLAGRFEEQNHVYGVHPVSHLATVASGELEDGRSFDLRAVEVDLELVQVRIDVR